MNTGWQPHTVVAATDFSVPGEQAVERAALLARDRGARLTLQYVVPASLFDDVANQIADAAGIAVPSREALRDDALAQLARRAAEIAQAHAIDCDARVTVGRPAAEIARAAAGADLLVVGAHGEHTAAGLLLGTTAQKLLRVSPCPLLVVKRAPAFAYRTVLAPTDFSRASAAAPRAIAALAPNATLHLAHAFELPYDGLARFAAADEAVLARYHAAEADRLRLALAEFADACAVPLGRRALHVAHGYPPSCIERWVDALGADLVAIAAHGKSELESTFLGSVSLHTVMTAPCDVLVLRGAGFA